MAHKKGQGSSNNGRESHSKRLGVKLFGGQVAIPGNILVRQRGTQFHPGEGVGIGKDHTIFAKTEGIVTFATKKNNRKYISVLPANGASVAPVVATVVEEVAEAPKKAKKATKKGDDLKKINGVGPAFEERLNAQGLFTYADVAALTPEAIAKIEEQDNITSDEDWNNWIEQAKTFLN